jgi:hypothetical protein
LEDSEEVIRSRESKDRQCNGERIGTKKKDKKISTKDYREKTILNIMNPTKNKTYNCY